MSLLTMLTDNFVFFQEFVRDFQSTGSIWPTSKEAALALTKPLRERNQGAAAAPLRILEVGPGTGSVTLPILELMQPGDNITICEINPRFLERLQEKLEKNPIFQAHKEQVTFFEGPVQMLPETGNFQIIISALPFLNFDHSTVVEIFEKFRRLSSEGAVLSYYEYMCIRAFGTKLAPEEVRHRLRKLDAFFKNIFRHHLQERIQIWSNFPPVNVYLLSSVSSLKLST